MPVAVETINTLPSEHQQAVLHDMRFDEGKSCTRLVSEDVNRHVERRMIRQKDLQAGVFVAKKGSAFVLAFMAHDRTRLIMARKRLVKFLKNQNAGRGGAALDLDVFCRR